MRKPRGILAAITLCFVISLLGGCTSTGPIFISEDRSYTPTTVASVIAEVELGELAEANVAEAETLRHDALVALRSASSGGADAASLITSTFPSLARTVPLYVERASFDGKPAWILVEAVGPRSGKFENKRLWVLGDGGDILYSATR